MVSARHPTNGYGKTFDISGKQSLHRCTRCLKLISHVDLGEVDAPHVSGTLQCELRVSR